MKKLILIIIFFTSLSLGAQNFLHTVTQSQISSSGSLTGVSIVETELSLLKGLSDDLTLEFTPLNPTDQTEKIKAVKEMLDHDGPYLLHVRVEKEENVFPMVPSGAGVGDIRLE